MTSRPFFRAPLLMTFSSSDFVRLCAVPLPSKGGAAAKLPSPGVPQSGCPCACGPWHCAQFSSNILAPRAILLGSKLGPYCAADLDLATDGEFSLLQAVTAKAQATI